MKVNCAPCVRPDGVLSVAALVMLKSEKNAFVVPDTLTVHMILVPRCITGVVHASDDAVLGLLTIVYVCSPSVISDPPPIETDIVYTSLPPGTAVNTNSVPVASADGTVSTADDWIAKSENNAFDVPITEIVHTMFVPK